MKSYENKLQLNKYQKIELVRMLGLNTEENILIQRLDDSNILKYREFILYHNLENVSIRTMSEDDSFKTLHFPVVTVHESWDVISDLTSKNLSAIVATCIDPKHALLAGVIWKTYDKYSGELSIGPYTVRRVTREGIVDLSFEYFHYTNDLSIGAANPSSVKPETQMIRSLLSECTRIPFDSCLIETSLYSIPIGRLKRSSIIWDIDSDGSKDSALQIESYYNSHGE